MGFHVGNFQVYFTIKCISMHLFTTNNKDSMTVLELENLEKQNKKQNPSKRFLSSFIVRLHIFHCSFLNVIMYPHVCLFVYIYKYIIGWISQMRENMYGLPLFLYCERKFFISTPLSSYAPFSHFI